MLDANSAAHEDHCAGFVHETPYSNADQCFSQMHITNHCIVEDDFDDIAAFPVFSKRSSRRQRRTSLELCRKSLHNAQDVTDEEECDATPVTDITVTSDKAATDVEMSSSIDDVVFNKLAFPITESDCSLTSPMIDAERMYSLSDVKMPSIINSDSVVQPKTGIIFYILHVLQY